MKYLTIVAGLLCGSMWLAGCSCNPSPTGNGAATGSASTSTNTNPHGGGSGKPATQNDIDRFLAKKPSVTNPSPLVGQGANFQSSGQEYEVDPRFIVAIMAAETTYGTAKCHSTPVVQTHNAWNWFWCESNDTCGSDVCVHSPFDTWGSGIQTVSHFMRKNYINKGYTSVSLIASKYCTEGCGNWVPNVTASLQEMNGNPENLELKQ